MSASQSLRRHFLTLSLAAVVCLLLSPAAFAEKPASNAVQLDTAKSSITWRASKVTGKGHYGQLVTKASKVTLTDGNVSEAELVFDMSAITVTDLEGKWANKFLGHLKSEDFFEVAKHPTATWKLTSVKGGVAKGQLTIKGKTQPIEIAFAKADGAYKGKVTFDRTKFGIIYGSGSFFKNLGDKMIKDEVEIEFSLVLKS